MIDAIFYVAALFFTLFGYAWSTLFNLVHQVLINTLRRSSVPHHVAIVMDGNRRYALKAGLTSKSQGHYHGYAKFERILEWCFELGVKTVTVYALSLENLKRPEEEVTTLMQLAMGKLKYLADEAPFIHKNKVAIRIIGELEELPLEVQDACRSAMELTKDYSDYTVNICFPYTSRAEISHILTSLSKEGDLIPTRQEVSDLLYTSPHSSPDLIIRTGGDHRLSEFLTWQITEAIVPPFIAFTGAFWPDFSFINFVVTIVKYQLYINKLQLGKNSHSIPIATTLIPAVTPSTLIGTSEIEDEMLETRNDYRSLLHRRDTYSLDGMTLVDRNGSPIPSGQLTPISLADSGKASLIELDRLLKALN